MNEPLPHLLTQRLMPSAVLGGYWPINRLIKCLFFQWLTLLHASVSDGDGVAVAIVTKSTQVFGVFGLPVSGLICYALCYLTNTGSISWYPL